MAPMVKRRDDEANEARSQLAIRHSLFALFSPPPKPPLHFPPSPLSGTGSGAGDQEGRAPSVAGIPTEVEKIARPRMPLVPLPGPSPRSRGEGGRHPGSRDRLEKTAETRPVVAPPPQQNAHQRQTPPSPRERGEGEDEGRAPSVAGIPTEVEKLARRRPPLVPLPGPSPRLRGEGAVIPEAAIHWKTRRNTAGR